MGFKQAVGAFTFDQATLYDQWPGGWDAFITKLNGFQPNLVHWYQTWGGSRAPFVSSMFTQAINVYGATVVVSWAPRNAEVTGTTDATYKLSTITAGNHDAFLTEWAEAARDMGKGFFLRPMHEFNYSGIGPWAIGANGNVLADFVPAWQHMYDVVRAAGAWNIRFVWSPLAYGGTAIASNIYPGNQYVDVVALDGYNWNDNVQATGSYASIFGSAYDTVMGLCDNQKPFMVAEFGCGEGSAVESKDAWFQTTYDTGMRTRTPKLKYSVYFDANFTSRGEKDWRVNSSEASRLSYIDILDDTANMMEAVLGNFSPRFVAAARGGSGPAALTTVISRPNITLDPTRKQILLFKLHNGGAIFETTQSKQDPVAPGGSGITKFAQMYDSYDDYPANTITNTEASVIATVFSKVIDGTEPLNWTFSVRGTATSAWSWVCEIWEWVDVNDPFEDDVQVSFQGKYTADPRTRYDVLPLPTTVDANSVINWVVCSRTTATAPAQAPVMDLTQDPSLTTPETWPDDVINREENYNFITPGSGTSNARVVWCSDKVMPQPGKVGDFDVISSVNTHFVGIGFALRSAGAPAAPLETGSLAPDAFVGTPLNLTGSITAIQDDPDAPDGNWLLAP